RRVTPIGGLGSAGNWGGLKKPSPLSRIGSPAWERRCGPMRNEERDPGAGAGVPTSVFSHDDDASAAGPPRPVGPPEWAEKLRDIQSITDAALSMLDPRALLDALVDRAKEALQADTSAILLLDRRSGQLVATAASGLEEEVRQ